MTPAQARLRRGSRETQPPRDPATGDRARSQDLRERGRGREGQGQYVTLRSASKINSAYRFGLMSSAFFPSRSASATPRAALQPPQTQNLTPLPTSSRTVSPTFCHPTGSRESAISVFMR